jgi:flagellar basal body-associated protein FliL
MKKLALHAILAIALAFSAIIAADTAPQESESRDIVRPEGVSFDVSALETDLTTDDTLIVELRVTIHGEESEIDIAEIPTLAIESFDLISTGSSSMRSLDADLPSVMRTTIYYFRPTVQGSFSIPVLTLDYVDTRTGLITTLGSASIPLDVSAGSPGQVSMDSLLLLVVVLILTVSIATVIYARVRRWNATRHPDEETAGVARVDLLASLDRVEITLAHGRVADAQSALTTAVMQYIENEYAIHPQESDREKCHKAMSEAGAPNMLSDRCMQLLEWDQSLKFGGLPMNGSEIVDMLSSLRQVVEHH